MTATARLTISAIFFELFFLLSSMAQGLTIGAQVRPRAEFRNGYRTLTLDDRDAAFFVEQRTRIFTDFKGEKYHIRINFHDIRIWGSVDQSGRSDPNLTGLFEGWGEYYFNRNWSVRLGRMVLSYDNERFLGRRNWATQSRSDDALLFLHQNDSIGISFHAGAAFNQPAEPQSPGRAFGTVYTGVSNFKYMQFAWFQKKFDNTDLSLLFQNDGRQVISGSDTTTTNRQTYIITADHRASGWELGGQLGTQGGKNGANTSVSSLLASIYFTWKTRLTPITVGIDHLSGTSINDTKDKSFAPLYATNHKFYGHMDYFYAGGVFHGQSSNGTSGLNDIYLKTQWETGAKTSFDAHIHFFSSPAELFDPADISREIDKYLGSELDLIFTWNPAKNVAINFGYSQMWATSSMEAVKSTPGDHSALNNWAWFMVDFAPVIFQKEFSKD